MIVKVLTKIVLPRERSIREVSGRSKSIKMIKITHQNAFFPRF